MACRACNVAPGEPCRFARINGAWLETEPEVFHPTRVADAELAEKLKEKLS